MNWLKDLENEHQKKSDDSQRFWDSMKLAIAVFDRIKLVHPYRGVERKGSEFSGLISRGSEYRQYSDLYIPNTQRILTVNHYNNRNVFSFSRREYEDVFNNHFSDDPADQWSSTRGEKINESFKYEISDAQLSGITENEWINIFGWLMQKSDLEILDASFSRIRRT